MEPLVLIARRPASAKAAANPGGNRASNDHLKVALANTTIDRRRESDQRQDPCGGEAAGANGNADGGSAKPVEYGETQIDAAD